MTGEFFPPGKLPRARSLVQKIRQVYVKQPLARYLLTSALHGVQYTSASTRLGFIAATIFGCDLGPNLTTVGSLATILWLLILRRRNLEVSGLDYFKIGILVTPLMLIAGALTIWLLLPR